MARRATKPFTYFAVLTSSFSTSRIPVLHSSPSFSSSPPRIALTPTNKTSGILARYPKFDYEDSPFPDTLPMYCFPNKSFLHSCEEKHFHMFVITEDDGNKMYGGCLIWKEPENPDEGIAICLLSHFSFFEAIQSFLEGLYNLQAEPTDYTIEQYVSLALTKLPLPEPGCGIDFWIGDKNVIILRLLLTRLPNSQNTLGVLFRYLDFPNLFTAFTAILLEKKVIVRSEDTSAFTPFCEAMLSLLFPFSYTQTYIPMLPDAMIDVVLGSNPYFVGVNTAVPLPPLPSDVIIIDLCHNTITGAEQLPELADSSASELIRSLCRAAERFHAQPAAPQPTAGESDRQHHHGDENHQDDHHHDHHEHEHEHGNDNEADGEESHQEHHKHLHDAKLDPEQITEDAAASAAVRSAFLQFFVRLLSNYRSFISPDDVHGGFFNQSQFVSSLVAEQRGLMQAFAATESFQSFIAARVGPTSASMRTQIELFDRCIQEYVARDDHVHSHCTGVDETLGRRSMIMGSVSRALCSSIDTMMPPGDPVPEDHRNKTRLRNLTSLGQFESELTEAGSGDRRVKRRLSMEMSIEIAKESQKNTIWQLLLAEVTRMTTAIENAKTEITQDDEREKRFQLLASVLGGTLIKICDHGGKPESDNGTFIEITGGGFMQRLLKKKIEITSEPGSALWGLIEVASTDAVSKDYKEAVSKSSKARFAREKIFQFVFLGIVSHQLSSWVQQMLANDKAADWIMMNRPAYSFLRNADNIHHLIDQLKSI